LYTSTKILVVDTSIWIDLSNTELVDHFFKLPYSILVTDFVLSKEYIHFGWKNLEQKGLRFQGLDPQGVAELFEFSQTHRKVSFIDLAMFIVARKVQGILLTGDDALRHLAMQELEVHGFLWVMDRMVDHSILEPMDAINRLYRILELLTTRIPKNECDKLIKKWKKP